jgi:hypothetical protein
VARHQKVSLDSVYLATHLKVGCEGVRKPHVTRKGTEDEIAELDAIGWDDVTEAVVVVTQELWEVVQQYQKYAQCALMKFIDIRHRSDQKSTL